MNLIRILLLVEANENNMILAGETSNEGRLWNTYRYQVRPTGHFSEFRLHLPKTFNYATQLCN